MEEQDVSDSVGRSSNNSDNAGSQLDFKHVTSLKNELIDWCRCEVSI